MKSLTPKEKENLVKIFLTGDLKEKPKIDNTSFEVIMKEMSVELKAELKKEGLL